MDRLIEPMLRVMALMMLSPVVTVLVMLIAHAFMHPSGSRQLACWIGAAASVIVAIVAGVLTQNYTIAALFLAEGLFVSISWYMLPEMK